MTAVEISINWTSVDQVCFIIINPFDNYGCTVVQGDECISGSVQLVNGTDNSSGLVELCIFGFWEPVCGDSFTENEGMVVCQQLGEYSDG